MKQLEALGTRLDGALTRLEAKTAAPVAGALLGAGLGVAAVAGGLVALVIFLKLLVALF